MPIDSDFPKNHEVMGKHSHADGEHFHFVWGPGRPDAERGQQSLEVQEAYKVRGEEYVPLGVHGTTVKLIGILVTLTAHVLKHVRYRFSNGIEQNKDIPAHRNGKCYKCWHGTGSEEGWTCGLY